MSRRRKAKLEGSTRQTLKNIAARASGSARTVKQPSGTKNTQPKSFWEQKGKHVEGPKHRRQGLNSWSKR